MQIDKIKIYALEFLLLVVLLLAIFESNIISKSVLAFILLIYVLILRKTLKKRKATSIYKKQVIYLFIAFSFIYLALFYLSGLYFGYYESSVKFSFWGITHYILPTTIIVVCSELIRFIFLSQKDKLGKSITFISMVLIDIIVYSQIYDLTSLDDFLTVMGFIIFSSIACNLLYNYTSTRFGYKPIITYRLITGLYSYIIPIIPKVMIFFRTVFRMIYPYFVYMILEYSYSKSNRVNNFRERKGRIVGTTLLIVISVLITMLVSCKFTYGAIVVGSGSMTGTINKGDVIIYEKYENQKIQQGDIIIFIYQNSQIIHRVIKTEIVNKEYRYYTKGDANQEIDNWYVTQKDIVGIFQLKVKYVGYPTIWVNDIFK